ncbi:MAG: CPBP family intramembrane metalloprotease [Candidatus Rokubacteria bacterium]|nr:CPBP family intramembrane metalloprotease [Candidatus Rokubacteria bacterium]
MRPRVWPVFLAYVLAFMTIVSFSVMAAMALRAANPDIPERDVFEGLPGLIAGGLASSSALLVTLIAVNRPLQVWSLRLRPGRERGRDLAVIIVGVLALGQALDSLTTLAGLATRGSLSAIRRAVYGAGGPELFAAVVVIGILAGTAEELFFRGYMETRLRLRLHPGAAVVATSFCFGLMHFEWLHAFLAFALALYLGYVTEVTGSVLPAIAAHVVNNTLFTLLTAAFGEVAGRGINTALLLAGIAVFAACLVWLRRVFPTPVPLPLPAA